MTGRSSIFTFLHMFVDGLADSLSLHKTLKILVNSKGVTANVIMILLANGGLLVGSATIFDKVLSPSLEYLQTNFMPDMVIENETPKTVELVHDITTVFYNCLWLAPVLALCYGCSSFWYQDIADQIYTHVTQKTVQTDMRKGVKASLSVLYATLVWLLLFIETKLFLVVTPICVDYLESLLSSILGINAAKENKNFAETYIFSVNFIVFCTMKLISKAVGNFILCAMYGWYAFDYSWAAENIQPDIRFQFVEEHWPYFVGFGLPYVVLLSCTSFFYGYGLFLVLFPFSIIIGSTSEYKSVCPEAAGLRTPSAKGSNMLRIRIFQASQQLALRIITEVDRQITAANEKRQMYKKKVESKKTK